METTQWPPCGLKTMYFSPKNIREMENRRVQGRQHSCCKLGKSGWALVISHLLCRVVCVRALEILFHRDMITPSWIIILEYKFSLVKSLIQNLKHQTPLSIIQAINIKSLFKEGQGAREGRETKQLTNKILNIPVSS